MERQLLIETMEFVPLETAVMEATEDGSDRLVMRGIFQRSDTVNSNQRIYPRQIWERVVGDPKYTRKLEERAMFGELDHPADGKTKLSRCSHIVTGLRLEPDGTVLGEAEVLDTPNGRILRSIIECGGKVAVSSRGTGSVSKATNQVQDDFVLETFDFVANPSTFGAYPTPVRHRTRRSPVGYAESTEEPNLMSVEEAKEKITGAKRFLIENPVRMDLDNARKVELITQLLEREIAVGSMGLSENDAAGQLASEVSRELRSARTSLEESMKQIVGRSEPAEFGGSDTMAGTANNEAKVQILEHQNAQLEQSVEALQENLEEVTQGYQASLRIIEELKDRFKGLQGYAQQLTARSQAADNIIEELYSNLEKLQESTSSGELTEEKMLEREAAAVALIEAQQRRLRTSEQIIEELGERLVASEQLTEALLDKVHESIMEAAIEQSLASLGNEEYAEKVRPFLHEAATVEDVNTRFSAIVELTETAPIASAAPVYQDARQPLPTAAARQQVARSGHTQQLMESAQTPPPNSGVALAQRLDRILGGK